MEQLETKPTLNPWISIWTNPRGTIRQIVDSDPDHHVILLAVLSGIFNALDNAAERSLGDHFSLVGILVICIGGGAIAGIISLYISGVLFRWSGNLLGGHATSEQVRAAIAWSSITDVILLLLFIPVILIFGQSWFVSSGEVLDSNIALFFIFLLAIVGIAMVIWRALLFVKCLAEVHQFSAWKGLAAAIIGILVLVVLLACALFAAS